MEETTQTTRHEVKRGGPLYLMRHGDYDLRDGMSPRSLEAITAAAETIRGGLAEHDQQLVHIWYSPLKRARATAAALKKELSKNGIKTTNRAKPRLNYEVDEEDGVAYAVSRIKRPGVIITHEPNLKAYTWADYDYAQIRRIE